MQEDTKTEVLDAIKAFGEQAHKGQIRKYTGEPYYNHPVRVMETCRRVTTDISILSAALLHDVLEDTHIGEDELKQFLLSVMTPNDAERTLNLVIQLTDVYIKSDYPRMNRRKRKELEHKRLAGISTAAQTIKYADVIDNSPNTAQADPDFAPKLLKEYRQMLGMLDKGNPQLHKEATEAVQTELEHFQ